MSKHLPRQLVADRAVVHERLPTPVEIDRSFELPKGLYAATVGLYLGFIAVMGLGLRSPGLVIPMAIFAIFFVAGFGLPAVWTRIEPCHGSKQMSLEALMRRGIATHTGHLAGRDAVLQVLILPVLILLWGLATITIAAAV